MDTHHIIPKSRKLEGYNVNNDSNLLTMRVKTHANFHRIFQNLTPQEQFEILFAINSSVYSEEVVHRVEELIFADVEDFYREDLLT